MQAYLILALKLYMAAAFIFWLVLFIKPYWFGPREMWAQFYDEERRKHPDMSERELTWLSIFVQIFMSLVWPWSLVSLIRDKIAAL